MLKNNKLYVLSSLVLISGFMFGSVEKATERMIKASTQTSMSARHGYVQAGDQVSVNVPGVLGGVVVGATSSFVNWMTLRGSLSRLRNSIRNGVDYTSSDFVQTSVEKPERRVHCLSSL